MTTVELAQKIYCTNDDNVIVNSGAPIVKDADDNGGWVQAWVFVSHETIATSSFGALGK